ncbi:MAG: outer membrane protein [Bacteroidota bacterium]|jgi:hypothetical protein|nr:outer membrane protein [Bacteroidota bacterium]
MRGNLKYCLILVVGLLSVKGGFSQSNKGEIKKKSELAEAELASLDYLKAFNSYSKLIKLDSTNSTYIYKAGLCLFNLDKTDTSCLNYFFKTQDKIPESHFYIGRVYQLNGQTRKALEEFYYFKTVNDHSIIKADEVSKYIKICETALQQELQKGTYVVKNAGKDINTNYPEYVPLVWSLDESMFFTSRRPGSTGGLKDVYGRYFEDIYITKKTGRGLSAPVSLSDSINTFTHDACVAFSPSGNELIIYRTNEKQTGGDLYITKYDGLNWSAPEKLGREINSGYLEASACFSADGNEIVFSSNRPGGYGGKDLYKIVKFMNGKYSLPFNLGPHINSLEDEDAPFIDKNDNTLYFSSKGHNTMGEYDIFKAVQNPESSNWTKIENMGMPVNSTNDDIYFVKHGDNGQAFFASRRVGGYGDADIYEVNFNESTQLIIYGNINTNKIEDKTILNDLRLSVYDSETGVLEGVYRPNKNYMTFILVALKNKPYRILVEGKSIDPVIRYVNFSDTDKEISIEVNKRLK